MDTAIYALPMKTLIARTHGPDPKRYLIELYNRFSLPFACLVLMLVGVPLGANSRRGGKSSGFVFTILLVFIYYFLSYIGIALGKLNKLPPFLAVWSANLLFAIVGIFLLWQMATGGRVLTRHLRLDFASRHKNARVKPALANGNGYRSHRVLRQAAAAGWLPHRHTRQVPRRLSAHSRRVRRPRVPDHVPAGARRLRAADHHLHLLRPRRRHHSQSRPADHSRRVSLQSHAQP